MQISLSARKAVLAIAHVLLWLLLVTAAEMSIADFIPGAIAWQRACFIIGLCAIVFYTNANILINYLLERQKKALYAIALLALIAAAITVRLIVEKTCTAMALPLRITTVSASHKGMLVIPTLLAVIFSTCYQLLLNHYNRERHYLLQISELGKAQITFLKNQINPHFLFNNLNNIYSLIVTGAPGAGDAVLKLSDLLRYVIYRSDAGKVPLKEECAQINNLIELFRLKDDTQNVQFNTSGISVDAVIEPMLLIPVIENCFKHSDDITAAGSYISIVIVADAEWITCTTENTIPAQKPSGHTTGVGLANIQQRRKHVYGADNYIFNSTPEANIFKTKLKIRWKRSFPA